MKDKPPPNPMTQPDRRLDAIKSTAERENIDATQQLLGQETDDMLRRYATRAALSGSGVTPPLRMGG